jgi:hypothetical protein
MFIAVSNAHGWAKAKTDVQARVGAFSNSVVKDDRVKVKVWACQPDAHVNDHGEVFGVLDKGTEYQRKGKSWVPAAE